MSRQRAQKGARHPLRVREVRRRRAQTCVERGNGLRPAYGRRPKLSWCVWRAMSGVRQGEGTPPSARVLADAAAGTPFTRERTGREARISRQAIPGYGVCKVVGQEEVKPHNVRYYLERRRSMAVRDPPLHRLLRFADRRHHRPTGHYRLGGNVMRAAPERSA
jgi:hypothetical protein